MASEAELSDSLSYWINVPGWLRVASGERTMPQPFQRFIAGWEVVVAWHRNKWPKQRRDEELKQHLREVLPSLELLEDPKWLMCVQPLLRWTVEEMSGAKPTGKEHQIETAALA